MAKKKSLSIGTATVIVGILALIGTTAGNFLEGFYAQRQQQKEFESTLIINAIETGNSKISKNNLQFLLDANLLTDEGQKMRLSRILKDSNYIIKRGFSEISEVYICKNIYSKKYHFSSECRALKNCEDSVINVSIKQAKLLGRSLCGWEN